MNSAESLYSRASAIPVDFPLHYSSFGATRQEIVDAETSKNPRCQDYSRFDVDTIRKVCDEVTLPAEHVLGDDSVFSFDDDDEDSDEETVVDENGEEFVIVDTAATNQGNFSNHSAPIKNFAFSVDAKPFVSDTKPLKPSETASSGASFFKVAAYASQSKPAKPAKPPLAPKSNFLFTTNTKSKISDQVLKQAKSKLKPAIEKPKPKHMITNPVAASLEKSTAFLKRREAIQGSKKKDTDDSDKEKDDEDWDDDQETFLQE